MHSSRNLRKVPATNKPELLDLSYPYRRPTAMLMAAHDYAAAAHKRALHDSRLQLYVDAVRDSRCDRGARSAETHGQSWSS